MMSATRLLILGALRFMQPAHGYSIRRELESWRAEEWANIAYGSIYFALNKMAEEELVAVSETDQVGKRPARTTYVITDQGEIEFHRLLREFWWEYKPIVDPFMVAASFMNELPRDELIAALRHHASLARLAADGLLHARNVLDENDYKPRHVEVVLKLLVARIKAEISWSEEVIGMVERGELP
jgi:DNA-binding PadR family transcriptional regulator